MKKSFIIYVNDLTKKVVFFLSLVLTFVFLVSSGILGNVFRSMAYDAVFANEENFLKNAVSFDTGEMICKLTNSAPKAKIEEETKKETLVAKNEEKNEKGNIEISEEPQNVDFSKEKSQKSVTADNIIVTNGAGKNFGINALLSLPLAYTKNDGYKVLIIHTHTTESYLPNDRCEDQEKNVVRVGAEFAKVLNENNIKTLHIKKVHDAPYNKSYINELATIEETLKQYPSIEVIIDVHRDALYNSKNEKIKPVTTINGEKVAQVMLVCGTNAMGLQHDYWQNCFSFALKVQKNMNEHYPNFARPINLREERFNTHKTKNSVIFEIGSNGNTLQEAVLAGRYAAKSIAEVINEN